MRQLNILIVGANGQLGRYLIKYIVESNDHSAVALVNNGVQKAYFTDMGVETLTFDLNQKLTKILKLLRNIDALVITGSLDEKNKETLTEIDEMLKLVDAAIYAGVSRIIYVSTFETQALPLYFRSTFVKKYYIEKWLKLSGSHFTIIQAGTLVDRKGTGLVEIGSNVKNKETSKEDIAQFILACLENDATIRKTIKVVSGKTPIQQILSTLK